MRSRSVTAPAFLITIMGLRSQVNNSPIKDSPPSSLRCPGAKGLCLFSLDRVPRAAYSSNAAFIQAMSSLRVAARVFSGLCRKGGRRLA